MIDVFFRFYTKSLFDYVVFDSACIGWTHRHVSVLLICLYCNSFCTREPTGESIDSPGSRFCSWLYIRSVAGRICWMPGEPDRLAHRFAVSESVSEPIIWTIYCNTYLVECKFCHFNQKTLKCCAWFSVLGAYIKHLCSLLILVVLFDSCIC